MPEEGVPGGGHRYVLVFLNGVAIVDAIYVANLPCFDGGLPWLWGSLTLHRARPQVVEELQKLEGVELCPIRFEE